MRGKRVRFRGAAVAGGVLIGLVASAEPAVAQDFSLVTTLVHPNQRPNNEDRFGSGIAVDGDNLFVGAKDEGGANDYSGVVHVFSQADWSEVAQLQSSVDKDIEFGSGIEVDGERALISNMAIDGGVVWFFERVEGVWTEKLRVQGLVDEAFGYRTALRGDYAFIAAPRVGTGNVHVYRRAAAGEWAEVQVLTADDALAQDFFGYALSFDGQRLAVAAPGSGLGAVRSGVYTFSKQGDAFVQDAKLSGEDPAAHWFGADVEVSGDTLIVNAPPAYQAMSVGKALVYQRRAEQWELASELTVEGEDSFPTEVTLTGETAWLGARTDEPGSRNIYAFQRGDDGWQRAQKLAFPTPGEYELTSWHVRDATLAVGFWNGLRTESVQVYRGADYQGSPGGTSAGGMAGMEALGGGLGASPGDSNAARGGAISNEGGAGPAAQPPMRAGGSEPGSCALARSSATVWPVTALALALALTRRRARAARCRNGLASPARPWSRARCRRGALLRR